jgi:hypothetical protein
MYEKKAKAEEIFRAKEQKLYDNVCCVHKTNKKNNIFISTKK